MSLTPYFRNSGFEPQQIDSMSEAFETACRYLGLSDRSDRMAEQVARHIVEAAQRGMRTPSAMFVNAIIDFKPKPADKSPRQQT
jgi:hypothetical protein